MIVKHNYRKPEVRQTVPVSTDVGLLAGSAVDEPLGIVSDGQEVTDIDAGSETFGWNANWDWQ